MSLFEELKRRNVIRVATAYVVAAWLSIQVVETILPAFGYSDAVLRYIVVVLVIAFIPALALSWVFEITPEGLKREVDVVREHSITRFTGKKLDRIIMLMLVFALGYFVFDKFVLDPVEDIQIAESAHEEGRSEAITESYGDKSIAVLPFVNMSSDPEQEYFSDGISEELLNLLSKIPDLRVISRSSAFSFKGKNIDIPTIAAQLEVAHILEGSVRKAGNQVRVTAQLIEARSDRHLWSETYDRELENIFAIQYEISEAIAGALKERLGLEVQATRQVIATNNTDAHEAYLRGRYLVVQRTSGAIEGAVREFEKAIELDPEYALAYAELAMAMLLSGRNDGMPDIERNAQVAPYAEKAMALDPNLAEAHAAAGFLLQHQWERWDRQSLEAALMHYEQAIKINPNYSIVYTWMAGLLRRGFGRYAEAFAASETALRLDPMSIPARSSYVTALINRDRLEEAGKELEKLADIAPGSYLALRGRLNSLGTQWANSVLARLDVLKANPGSGWTRISLARPFAAIGLEKEARAIYEKPWPVTFSMLGRPADSLVAAEGHFAENTELEGWEAQVGLSLAAVGDYARARPVLEKMWQFSGKRVMLYNDTFAFDHAVALAVICRSEGEEGRVDELVAVIRQDVRRFREAGMKRTEFPLVFDVDFEEGLADFLAGERERGLSLVAKAAENGYFIAPAEAYLQLLYDDPGFAPIMAGQQARQARERERFLSTVCTDNPYKEVWQPAEGTCE